MALTLTREQIIEKWRGMARWERDEWVAETVMRWEWYIPDNDEPTGWYSIDTECYTGKAEDWSPTTDISAAWEVVEELRKDWLVELHDTGPFGWKIELFSDTRYRTDMNGVIVRKVEEAICLAALIAKLTKEESE